MIYDVIREICDTNFAGLVLGCIEADIRSQKLIGELLTKSNYQIYILLHNSNRKISTYVRQSVCQRLQCRFIFSKNFITIVADVDENLSDFIDLPRNAEVHCNSPKYLSLFSARRY